MEKGARKKTELIEQNDALTNYLEALLAEVGFGDDTLFAEPEATGPVVVAEEYSPPAPVIVESRAEALALASVASESVAEAPPAEVVEVTNPNAPIDPPGWVQDRLQYLSFQIAGMTFAAPLEQLNGILPWNGTVTALPGNPIWFLGLLRNRDRNVQVVDIGVLLRQQSKPPTVEPRFLVLMGNGAWGVVCDRVSDVLRLNKADIQWRVPHKKVPFVIGTAPEKMCAIFDVPYFVELLAAGGF